MKGGFSWVRGACVWNCPATGEEKGPRDWEPTFCGQMSVPILGSTSQ